MRWTRFPGLARTWRRGAVAAAVLLAIGMAAAWPLLAAGGPAQIWFTPLTWNPGPEGHHFDYSEHDFPALLRPDAPWQTAASRVAVFGVPAVVVLTYPDIPGLLASLRAHRWQVSIGFGVLFDGGQCTREEGISKDPDINRGSVRVARTWRQDGGSLDYIIMDSPLWFGHYEPTGCRFTTAEVARRAGVTLRAILEQFPNARIVDAEGPGPLPMAQWLPEVAAFRAAVGAAAGRPMDFITLDLHWHDPRMPQSWQDTARGAAAYLHKVGMSVGLIVNAPGGPGMTLPVWMEANREHLREAARGRLGLDYVAINQWQGVARLNLPENDPNAYTSLIDEAFADFR